MTDGLPTESEVRAMRDLVFQKPISDREWENCKDNWMNPTDIAWLRDKSLVIQNANLHSPHR